jgi:hypothetical protein
MAIAAVKKRTIEVVDEVTLNLTPNEATALRSFLIYGMTGKGEFLNYLDSIREALGAAGVSNTRYKNFSGCCEFDSDLILDKI